MLKSRSSLHGSYRTNFGGRRLGGSQPIHQYLPTVFVLADLLHKAANPPMFFYQKYYWTAISHHHSFMLYRLNSNPLLQMM